MDDNNILNIENLDANLTEEEKKEKYIKLLNDLENEYRKRSEEPFFTEEDKPSMIDTMMKDYFYVDSLEDMLRTERQFNFTPEEEAAYYAKLHEDDEEENQYAEPDEEYLKKDFEWRVKYKIDHDRRNCPISEIEEEVREDIEREKQLRVRMREMEQRKKEETKLVMQMTEEERVAYYVEQHKILERELEDENNFKKVIEMETNRKDEE